MTAGLGSGSQTFTKSGTVVQTILPAEDIYSIESSYLGDTIAVTDESDYWGADPWATIKINTDAESIAVDTWETEHSGFNWHELGAYEDGVYHTSVLHGVQTASDTKQILGLEGFSSGAKTITVMAGIQKDASRVGLWLGKTIRVPSGSTFAIDASTNENRVVIIGDSIVTQDAIPMTEHGWGPQVREGHTTGAITIDAYGTRRFSTEYVDLPGYADDTAERLIGANSNVVVFALGTNDYSSGQAHGTWQTNLATWVDAVRVLIPAVEFILLTPVSRVSPAVETANGAGSTLQNYRDSMVTVAGSRAWVTTLDGPTICPLAGDYASDGVHLTNQGQDKIAAAVLAAL
jgi:lysophospholipase L1-like esterase